MTIEKKTIRSDIPGHQTYLNGNIAYAGTPVEEQRRMIVSRDIAINGSIASCDHLLIEGNVEAAQFSARRLDILEPGLFVGSADVNEAVIAGRFEGRLVVNGRLTLKPSARVYGDIQYGALEIESGAVVEGQLAQIVPPAIEAAPEAEVKLQAPVASSNVENLFPEEEEGDNKAEEAKGPRVFRRAVGY